MMTFNALELIRRSATIRGDVLANRDACRTDFARRTHDRLVEKLDQIAADLREEIVTERELLAELGTPDGDAWYEIYHTCTFFEVRWVESGPISLADPIYEDVVAEGEGESCRIGVAYTTVPDSELEGLADILDTIRRRLYIVFVVARRH